MKCNVRTFLAQSRIQIINSFIKNVGYHIFDKKLIILLFKGNTTS